MEDRMRESLSALMDDEANELEVERVLSRIGDDIELRRTWVRYNAVRSVAGGQSVTGLSVDISRAVSAAINSGEYQADNIPAAGRAQRLLRPLASFAVAASVAAVVVIGGQQLSQVGAGSGSPAIAAAASPVGMGYVQGGTPVRASYGTQALPVLQPATRTAYRELARQRMQKYMQEHAEHAALNSPQGLIPFARVPQIKE